MSRADLEAYCGEHAERFVSELADFCRIPSISADPAHAPEVRRNAEYLMAEAQRVGFTTVELLETGGHPAVYAERIVDGSRPTVLVYGHHDVQPVDPLDEWTSPPFEPEVRDGILYARGAVDDKGQVWMHLKAVQAWLATADELPVNLKLIVEGEEEIGSVHFDALVERERLRFAADLVVVSDTPIFAKGVPSLTTGLRGLATVEVEVTGARVDLHSGLFGGAVVNPVTALTRIIAALHDAEGRVTVPGFYDAVVAPSAAERADFARLPFSEEAFLREASDAPGVAGESGWSTLERLWVRPTLEINGIWGGYSGPGSKTIVPSRAGAKISCRLVPDQDPMTVAELVAEAVRAAAPRGVVVTATPHAGGRPVLTPSDHPAIAAARVAMAAGFGAEPAITRSGGSIPPVESFARLLGIPTVLIGVGLPDDNLHAPNEHFDLDQYQRGIRVMARLWEELPAALAVGAGAGPGAS
ncbi:MAG: dipeptidase [Candidatus Dormibacteria bacterium]